MFVSKITRPYIMNTPNATNNHHNKPHTFSNSSCVAIQQKIQSWNISKWGFNKKISLTLGTNRIGIFSQTKIPFFAVSIYIVFRTRLIICIARLFLYINVFWSVNQWIRLWRHQIDGFALLKNHSFKLWSYESRLWDFTHPILNFWLNFLFVSMNFGLVFKLF